MTRQQLRDKIETAGYNNVSGFVLPDGALVLFLTHSVSMDDAVMVRVSDDNDILPLWADGQENPDYQQVNTGGGWPLDDRKGEHA